MFPLGISPFFHRKGQFEFSTPIFLVGSIGHFRKLQVQMEEGKSAPRNRSTSAQPLYQDELKGTKIGTRTVSQFDFRLSIPFRFLAFFFLQGFCLEMIVKARFYQFLFHPRPPALSHEKAFLFFLLLVLP